MDLLFANALGEDALVQTHACEDPKKGKGVFALLPIAEGDVALRDRPAAFATSHELTAAAIADPEDVPPRPSSRAKPAGAFDNSVLARRAPSPLPPHLLASPSRDFGAAGAPRSQPALAG